MKKSIVLLAVLLVLTVFISGCVGQTPGAGTGEGGIEVQKIENAQQASQVIGFISAEIESISADLAEAEDDLIG